VRTVWIDDVEFAWVLGEFLRLYAENFPDEPIPPPHAEDVYRAASAVMAINEPVFGRPRYRSLKEKLAALVYELCKQHFFLNGNKRIAYFFLIYVLRLNERRIEVSTFEEKARVMERVADSDPKDRKRVLRELAELIRTHTRPLHAQPVTESN
jgi:death-on-curing family protein